MSTTLRVYSNVIAVLLLLLPLLIRSARPTAALDPARVAEYIRAQMRASGLPGAAVAVVQEGRLVYVEGFGRAGPNRAVEPDTPFILGSASKAVTSLAVMRLVEAGDLELDAPIVRYLPGFSLGEDPAAERITVRHLLQHRSGIPRGAGFLRFDPTAPAPSAYPHVRLTATPGTRFEYSNLNYVLLGRVVEEITGESFGAYLRRAVFEPVGMRAAYTRREEAESAGLAAGHAFLSFVAVEWREPAYARASVPAGFVVASAEDMARFLAVQMAAPGAPALLSPGSLTVMHTPGSGERHGYAAGWRVLPWEDGAERLIVHDGLTGRYSAAMGFVPERDVGVVVLTNANAGIFQPLATEMLVNTLRIVQGASVQPGWPVERLVRTGIALLLLVGVAGFFRRLRRWRQRGRPRHVASGRYLLRDSAEAVISLLALVFVPGWVGISLATMLSQQPDLGVALVAGATVAVADAVLKSWLQEPRTPPTPSAFPVRVRRPPRPRG